VHYNGRGTWGHLEVLKSQQIASLDVRLGDVKDPYFVWDLVHGCDTVFHLAALIGIPFSYQAPASYIEVNVHGTLHILEACRRADVRRVIVTSTSEVYGSARYTPIDESHPLQAQSPYAASKVAADKLAESYFCTYDLPIVVLRPFNTYGPRQSSRAVIPTVLGQALSGGQEIRLGNLAPKRDLTFVEDTVEAYLLAAEVPGIEGEVIHIGQGWAVSVGELAQRCLVAAGSKATVASVSERRRPANSEVELLLCDPAKAQRILGWTPRVSLDEGLRRTAEYVQRHLELYSWQGYAI
jgi:dTDP-glucose 4,6-dehydratase